MPHAYVGGLMHYGNMLTFWLHVCICSRAKQSANTEFQPLKLPLPEPAEASSSSAAAPEADSEVEIVFPPQDGDDEDAESAEAVANALKDFHDADVAEQAEAENEADYSLLSGQFAFEDVFSLDDPLCMNLFSPDEAEPIQSLNQGDDLEDVEGTFDDEDVDAYLADEAA